MIKHKVIRIFFIVVFITILGVLLFSLSILMQEARRTKKIEEIKKYGEKIEELDITPNTIIAIFDGEEILKYEIDLAKKQIQTAVESGAYKEGSKSSFYQVLARKVKIKMAKEEEYTFKEQELERIQRTETELKENPKTLEDILEVMEIEKEELWMSQEDFISYFLERAKEDQYHFAGMELTSKNILEGKIQVKDFIFSLKNKEFQKQKKFIDNLEQETNATKEKIEEIFHGYMLNATWLQERYVEDLILKEKLELTIK